MRFRDDDGATLVTTVVMLFVILAFVALAIDGGAAFLDIRKSQNAADNGALAAALEECAPGDTYGGDSEVAAETVASLNGYGNALYSPVAGLHKVAIDTVSGTYLMKAIPFLPDSIDVSVESYASCQPSPSVGTYALFGRGVCGNSTVQSSASDIVIGDGDPTNNINGAVYSGDNARLGSDPSADVEGPILTVGTAGNQIPDQPRDDVTAGGPPQPYPGPLASLEFADFSGPAASAPSTGGTNNGPVPTLIATFPVDGYLAPGAGGYVVVNYGNASVDLADLINHGFVDDSGSPYEFTLSAVFIAREFDLKVTGSGNEPLVSGSHKVTFVSETDIRMPDRATVTSYFMNNDLVSASSWGPGLLFFAAGDGANPACDDGYNQQVSKGKGIVGGGGQQDDAGFAWHGIMFAPFGEINVVGRAGSSNNGPLIGYNVKISGSSYSIGAADDTGFVPDKRVVLVDPTTIASP